MTKQQKIVSMFNQIAPTYDVANRVLSFGVDKNWRKVACNKALSLYGKNKLDLIADVACGTGDMCDYWQKQSSKNGIEVDKIVGIDPAVGMLEVAKQKVQNVEFVEGEAKNLPLEDETTDILSISYGLRNVVDRVEALNEFNRSLKQGGILVILEFTKLKKQNIMGKIRDFYMKKVLPKVGGVLSKNYEAYNYLPDSIDDFLTKEDLVKELKEAGFEILEAKGYSLDISTMFIARKI